MDRGEQAAWMAQWRSAAVALAEQREPEAHRSDQTLLPRLPHLSFMPRLYAAPRDSGDKFWDFFTAAQSGCTMSFTVTRRFCSSGWPPSRSGPRPTEWMRGSATPLSTR